jgi:hypothetical protein
MKLVINIKIHFSEYKKLNRSVLPTFHSANIPLSLTICYFKLTHYVMYVKLMPNVRKISVLVLIILLNEEIYFHGHSEREGAIFSVTVRI